MLLDIIVTEPAGALTEGGDWLANERRRSYARNPKNPAWNRFRVTFADGGELRLFDPRRLGRVRLDASRTTLGPDAEQISLPEFRERLGRAPGAPTAPAEPSSVSGTYYAAIIRKWLD